MLAEIVIVITSPSHVFCTKPLHPPCLFLLWESVLTKSKHRLHLKKKIKGQKNGKVPTTVAKGERHRWHSTFHQMLLGQNWIAEHCQYLCPSANSIFESLIPWAFVKQGALCWEQSCSQPPCPYAGMNGKMHKARQWEGQGIQQGGGGAQSAFHSPSVFFQCMYLLNFIYSLLKIFQTLSLFLKVLNIPLGRNLGIFSSRANILGRGKGERRRG